MTDAGEEAPNVRKMGAMLARNISFGPTPPPSVRAYIQPEEEAKAAYGFEGEGGDEQQPGLAVSLRVGCQVEEDVNYILHLIR